MSSPSCKLSPLRCELVSAACLQTWGATPLATVMKFAYAPGCPSLGSLLTL